jgi:hypothetical protein
MKRVTWVFASSVGMVGLACLATVPVACVSSSNPGAPDEDSGALPSEDSGALPGPDATLPPSDSGPIDSGADVAPDSADAAPAPLTLTVLLGGAPEPGVLVVFQDATGAVVTTATTDAAGSVSHLVVAGSQVTAVLGTTQSPNLVTIQDVEPGDAITVVDGSVQTANFSEQVSVALPAGEWDAATTTEYVYAGSCGDPIAYPVYLTSDCISGGQFPLFAIAEGLSSGVETAYTYQTGNAVLTDGGSADITVTHPWATATDIATLTATSLPEVLEDAGESLATVFLSYVEVSGGVGLSLPAITETTGSAPTSTFNIHSGYPDFVEAEAYAAINTGNDQEQAEVFALSRSAPPTASSASSLALGTLPVLTTATINGDDAGTPQQPNVSWTSTGPMAGANGMFVQLEWYAAPPDGGNASNGSWTIIAPPLVTSVTAPSMPSSASAFAPPSYASYNPPNVAAVQASFLAGYAGFRAQAGTIPVFTPYTYGGPSLPLLPANGASFYLSAIFQNQD